MEHMPKVSVIIPIYNTEKYLEECLNSVVGQTLEDIEIICIDDGSTDSSLTILREYEKKDSRISVLTQENRGSGAARNKGLSVAQGKYVAFMDADDYYPYLSVLERMVATAESNNVQICGGGVCVNSAGKTIPGIKRGSESHYEKNGMLNYAEVQCDYGYQRYIFECKMLKENGIIFPDYLRFQDPPFFVKAMLTAKQFYALSQDVYCYRWGHQNVAWTNRQVIDLVCGIRDVYELANDNNLCVLADKCLKRVNSEYKNIIYTGLLRENNQKLFYRLMQFNVRVNDLRNQEDLFIPLNMILSHIYTSKRHKTNYIITWLPQKIRGGICCYREHGLRYTLQRVKVHLSKMK